MKEQDDDDEATTAFQFFYQTSAAPCWDRSQHEPLGKTGVGFYRQDGLPTAQPTPTKHRSELKALTNHYLMTIVVVYL